MALFQVPRLQDGPLAHVAFQALGHVEIVPVEPQEVGELVAPHPAGGSLFLGLHVPQGAAYGVKVGNSLQQNQAIAVQTLGAQLAQVLGGSVPLGSYGLYFLEAGLALPHGGEEVLAQPGQLRQVLRAGIRQIPRRKDRQSGLHQVLGLGDILEIVQQTAEGDRAAQSRKPCLQVHIVIPFAKHLP